MKAISDIADDKIKNFISGSQTFVVVDQLATSVMTTGLAQTLELTFNAAGQICRLVKKNKKSTGENAEILMFPLE